METKAITFEEFFDSSFNKDKVDVLDYGGYLTHALTDINGRIYGLIDEYIGIWSKIGHDFYWSEIYIENNKIHSFAAFIKKGIHICVDNVTDEHLSQLLEKSKKNLNGDHDAEVISGGYMTKALIANDEIVGTTSESEKFNVDNFHCWGEVYVSLYTYTKIRNGMLLPKLSNEQHCKLVERSKRNLQLNIKKL